MGDCLDQPVPIEDGGDIAVVGVAGRFPGAASTPELWRDLLEGRDAITEIPADRW